MYVTPDKSNQSKTFVLRKNTTIAPQSPQLGINTCIVREETVGANSGHEKR